MQNSVISMNKGLPKCIHIRSLCERKFLFIMFLSHSEASNDFWRKITKPAWRDIQTISFPNEKGPTLVAERNGDGLVCFQIHSLPLTVF